MQRALLQREILSRIISAEARKVGVHASPAAVAKQRDDLLPSVGGRSGLLRQLAAGQSPTILAPSGIDRWFKDQVLYRRIATKLAVDGNPQSQKSIAATTKALIATGRAMEIRVTRATAPGAPVTGSSRWSAAVWLRPPTSSATRAYCAAGAGVVIRGTSGLTFRVIRTLLV